VIRLKFNLRNKAGERTITARVVGHCDGRRWRSLVGLQAL